LAGIIYRMCLFPVRLVASETGQEGATYPPSQHPRERRILSSLSVALVVLLFST